MICTRPLERTTGLGAIYHFSDWRQAIAEFELTARFRRSIRPLNQT